MTSHILNANRASSTIATGGVRKALTTSSSPTSVELSVRRATLFTYAASYSPRNLPSVFMLLYLFQQTPIHRYARQVRIPSSSGTYGSCTLRKIRKHISKYVTESVLFFNYDIVAYAPTRGKLREEGTNNRITL